MQQDLKTSYSVDFIPPVFVLESIKSKSLFSKCSLKFNIEMRDRFLMTRNCDLDFRHYVLK